VALMLTLGIAWSEQAYVYSSTARVLEVHGKVVLVHGGFIAPITLNATLKEGDTVRTDLQAYCLLQLPDGQKVTVTPGSEVTLWVFFHSHESGDWSSSFKAMKNEVETPFRFFTRLHKSGIDFEDESSNTLACSKG